MSNTFKLTEQHEFHQRVTELMTKAEELGIHIDFSYCNSIRTTITDTKTGKEYLLKDLDSGEPINEFPTSMEFKIIFTE